MCVPIPLRQAALLRGNLNLSTVKDYLHAAQKARLTHETSFANPESSLCNKAQPFRLHMRRHVRRRSFGAEVSWQDELTSAGAGSARIVCAIRKCKKSTFVIEIDTREATSPLHL